MNTYKAAAVIEATGVSPITLQRYMVKNISFQPCDDVSRGSGDKRGYSTRRAIQVAMTFEASRLGIVPSRGAKAAFEFTDKGNPGRTVGELYPLGTTLLVGMLDGKNKVVNVPPDLSIGDVLSTDGAVFIINCNNVVANVTEKLSSK
jgi:hypothetical protein